MESIKKTGCPNCMAKFKKMACPSPNCTHRSSRRWNMGIHIRRWHGGIGEPVELEKAGHEETSSSSGSNKNNVDNDSFGRSVSSRIFPKPPSSETNKISKRHNIWPGSDIIDQYYQTALEFEENRNKIKKITEIFGQFPFSAIQRINSDPFNFSSENNHEPPIPPSGTSFEKMQSISPPVESNRANDCDMGRIMEFHRTTQEKPKGLTFDEYRKLRPELTFDDYRKIRCTPVTDREFTRNGKGWVRRNLFGEIVDFSI
jgi:hypothetical protein